MRVHIGHAQESSRVRSMRGEGLVEAGIGGGDGGSGGGFEGIFCAGDFSPAAAAADATAPWLPAGFSWLAGT